MLVPAPEYTGRYLQFVPIGQPNEYLEVYHTNIQISESIFVQLVTFDQTKYLVLHVSGGRRQNSDRVSVRWASAVVQ
jgi:hypothetical protein